MAWFGDWFGDWFGSWFGDSGGNASFTATALVVTLSVTAPTVTAEQGAVVGASKSRGKKVQRAPKPVHAEIKVDAQTVYVFGFAPKTAAVANREVLASALWVGWTAQAPIIAASKAAIIKADAVKIGVSIQKPSISAIKNATVKAKAIGSKFNVSPVDVEASAEQDENEVLAVLILSGFLD